MKHALLVFVIVAVVAGIASAEPRANMSGGGDFSASAVLWFSGTNVTAQVSGNVTLKGELTIDGTKAAFRARGPLVGAASGDSDTMTGSGWTTFNARGTLDTGEAITLHGAIDLSTDDVDLSSQTAGSGTGSLYIVLSLPDQVVRLRGTATGTAGGGFVTPDDPQTMQVDGAGSFTFAVATRDAKVKDETDQSDSEELTLSWNTEEWPQELREQFVRMMEEESE